MNLRWLLALLWSLIAASMLFTGVRATDDQTLTIAYTEFEAAASAKVALTYNYTAFQADFNWTSMVNQSSVWVATVCFYMGNAATDYVQVGYLDNATGTFFYSKVVAASATVLAYGVAVTAAWVNSSDRIQVHGDHADVYRDSTRVLHADFADKYLNYYEPFGAADAGDWTSGNCVVSVEKWSIGSTLDDMLPVIIEISIMSAVLTLVAGLGATLAAKKRRR
jgi:hypothetical protein